MNALRKRVLLKSPVRKIRTPGSVRGLLGNWQSYRNGDVHTKNLLLYYGSGASTMSHISNLSIGKHETVIRGAKLVYIVKGKGPVLLVQPGGAGWGGDISPYIETLKPLEQVRTVVYLEPRGMGLSQRLENSSAYEMNEYVEDIEALRQYLNLPQLAILGHSHGGFVALKYAIRFPGQVERLVLVGTSPNFLLDEYKGWAKQRPGYAEAEAAFDRIEQDTSFSPEEKLRAVHLVLLPTFHFYNFQAVSSQFQRLIRNMIISVEPYDYFWNHDINSYDVRESLGAIIAPTLVIVGDDDLPQMRLGSKLLGEGIPKANVVTIERCGHWPMMEAPEKFFNLLMLFLS
jgi:proline iminopeptidase